MPRTLPKDWTETETSRGSGDETPLTHDWYEYRRKKSITVARFNLAKRAAIRQTLLVSHRETWSCPYCKGHSTARGKIRRINVRERFNHLAHIWKRETALEASMAKKAMHPAYQQIIGLGREAIPFILDDLEQTSDHWFWALRAITGENPVHPDHRGKVGVMTQAWLRWAKEHGY